MVEEEIRGSMYEYNATVDRVVDGDTVDVIVDLGFSVMTKQCLRVSRVDTPEVRGPERPDGLVSKKFVEMVIPPGSPVVVMTTKDKKGKYGRYLAEILFHDGDGELMNLSNLLLEEGLAKQYGV